MGKRTYREPAFLTPYVVDGASCATTVTVIKRMHSQYVVVRWPPPHDMVDSGLGAHLAGANVGRLECEQDLSFFSDFLSEWRVFRSLGEIQVYNLQKDV